MKVVRTGKAQWVIPSNLQCPRKSQSWRLNHARQSPGRPPSQHWTLQTLTFFTRVKKGIRPSDGRCVLQKEHYVFQTGNVSFRHKLRRRQRKCLIAHKVERTRGALTINVDLTSTDPSPTMSVDHTSTGRSTAMSVDHNSTGRLPAMSVDYI